MDRYRNPTLAEVEKRVEKLRDGVFVTCYLVIGLGGHFTGQHYIHDNDWFEIFVSVWWIPSGITSFLIAIAATGWITARIDTQSK